MEEGHAMTRFINPCTEAYRDNINVLETAKIDGKVEGRTEEKLEIAQNMKRKGYEVKAIAEIARHSGAA